MIQRVEDIYPRILKDELIRLARIDRDWVKWDVVPDHPETYVAECPYRTWIKSLWRTGADAFSMWAASVWLVDGPKLFRPSEEQCQALEQIEVRLTLGEYAQPYPTILIDFPKESYHPFVAILCHRSEKLLTCVLHSKDRLHDITTTIANDKTTIEESINKYDISCQEYAKIAAKGLRVAINSCLSLANYGCAYTALYGAETARDARLRHERSERGRKAAERLKEAMQLVNFTHEVKLRKEVTHVHSGEHSGKEVSPHWRRGHWAMQVYGPGRTLRKRILRLPILVRADKFIGDLSDTTTKYK